VLLAVLLLSCHSATKPNDAPIEISISEAMNNQTDYYLSMFVDSLSYIYMGYDIALPILNYVVSDNYILTFDWSHSIKCFNRKGEFLRQIGSRGKGPGEYADLWNLAIDEEKNAIYVKCNSGNMLVYNLQGEFIRKFPVSGAIDRIMLLDSDAVLAHISNFTGRENDRYLIYNSIGDTLAKFANPYKYTLNQKSWMGNELSPYLYKERLHVKDKGDTIYEVTPDFQFIPKYVFKNNYSIHPGNLTSEEYHEALFFWYLFETDSYLGFAFRVAQKMYHGYYDKVLGKAFSGKLDYSEERMNFGKSIINDMDDGHKYTLDNQISCQNNDIWLSHRSDFEMDKVPLQFREKLEKYRNSIDDEDPFFLVLMHLKKQHP
jgi:hypothetical protein